MGGRGGSSSLGGKGKAKSVTKFMGKRGKPKTIEDAMTTSNPHFYEGREWQYNCQRCIYAYEMQRRGYDVEAMPRIFDGTDTLPYMHNSAGWLAVMKDAKVVDFPSRNTIRRMVDTMADWGDGTRAIVRVRWKRGNSGHVFIAEQVGNGTEFIDPQTGQYVDIHYYMDNAIKGETKLVRIDNLEPTELIQKCVKKRGT